MSGAWGTRAWFEREFRASGPAADPWGHEWRASQRARHERLARLAAPLLAGSEAVLDVGCAYGALTARLAAACPGGRVVGLDLAEGAVRVARARLPAARFLVAALPALPLAPESCDVIVAAETLYYLSPEARIAAVAALHRALRPGGLLLFSTVLDDGARYFTPRSAQALLAACFQVEKVIFGYDGWVTRWETPWLNLERRASRGLLALLDDAEFAAWQAEHPGPAAARLQAIRRSRLSRAVLAWLLRAARGLIRWLLGWRWLAAILEFAARRARAGRSEIVLLAWKSDA